MVVAVLAVDQAGPLGCDDIEREDTKKRQESSGCKEQEVLRPEDGHMLRV